MTPKSATVTVTDARQTWWQTNVQNSVVTTAGTEQQFFPKGTAGPINFYGGQLTIAAWTNLSGANPRLPVHALSTITRNGTAVPGVATARTPFPQDVTHARIAQVAIIEPAAPPVAAETVVVNTDYFIGPAAATRFHHETETFTLGPSPSLGAGAEAGVLTADNAWIMSTLIPHMQRPAAPSHHKAFANLVAAAPPRLRLESMILRADSAAEVRRQSRDPRTAAAWYLGSTARTTILGGQSAAGVHDPNLSHDHVFIVRTTNPATGAKNTNLDEMAEFAAHEGIHAADTHIGAAPWDDYQREFRAYWLGGTGAGQDTGQMDSQPPNGPRSERANTIFRHLYGNPLYPTVKPSYDADTDGFKQKVDAYFHPDGVNLTLSATLFDLQREVESYTGTGFAAKRTAIQTKYAACTLADKTEVRTQNAWRRLVETKFTNATQRTNIMTELHIP